MNGTATFGDEVLPAGPILQCTRGVVLPASAKGKTMTSAMAAFGIAAAGTSLICYALKTQAERIKRNRRSAGDNGTDGGSTSGSDGWASWSGGHHSVTDSSGNPGDFGGGDSGGGGDGGGGDGGGGGD